MRLLNNRNIIIGLATLAVLILLIFVFPIFHITSLSERQTARAEAAFDPVGFVEAFWNGDLLPATDAAIEATDLIRALENDPEGAREKFAHQVGLSNTHYYFVRGEAILMEKGDYAMTLSLDGSQAAIIIEAGPVFGNTVRDGSGLLDVNEFPNSREFNQISAELNKRVEDVLEQLWEQADNGATVTFVGCVEVIDPAKDPSPMKVVPVIAEVK